MTIRPFQVSRVETSCQACNGRRILEIDGSRITTCRACTAGLQEQIECWHRDGMRSRTELVSAITRFDPRSKLLESAKAVLRRYQDGDDTIVLLGSPGTGKTMIAAILFNAWTNWKMTRFVGGVRKSFPLREGRALWLRGPTGLSSKSGPSIEMIERAGIVVMDDVTIGRSKEESAFWYQERQSQIIRARTGNLTIITGNVSCEDGRVPDGDGLIHAGWPADVVSRISSHIIPFVGRGWKR